LSFDRSGSERLSFFSGDAISGRFQPFEHGVRKTNLVARAGDDREQRAALQSLTRAIPVTER